MSTGALPSLLSVPNRRRSLVALIALVVGAVALTAALLLPGSGDSGSGSAGKTRELHAADFSIAYPAGWSAARGKDGSAAAAVLRRTDGHGTVLVRRKEAPRDQSIAKFSAGLTKGLERRFDDFRFVSARVVRIRGGNAFLYTFVRTKAKTAQSIALVRVGEQSFTIDAVAATGDQRAAREVAAIVRSFGR